MEKLIKIIYLFFFVFIANYCNAEIKPPFKNILVSKKPIYYENILFEDFDGKIVNLKLKKNKNYVLNFWATWCLPCKEEMPYLDKLQLNKNRYIILIIFFILKYTYLLIKVEVNSFERFSNWLESSFLIKGCIVILLIIFL